MNRYLRFWILAIASLVFPSAIYSQTYAEGCDGTRYATSIFSQVNKETVEYGKAIPENVNLKMDIYQPQGDQVQKRPLILWMHGGAFISGDKSDMDIYCRLYASRGFVTATLQYRLFVGIPNQQQFFLQAIKALSDMKAAYRFFKSDAANANKYQIDTTKMFIGGYSAGAVTSLNNAYLDVNDLNDPIIAAIIQANGGLSGNTGDAENHAHSDRDVFGVFNLSGGVVDKNIFDREEPFLMSYHGDIDNVVPIDSNYFFNIAKVYGSRIVTYELNQIGVDNILVVVPQGGHGDIYSSPAFSSYLAQYNQESIGLYYPKLCGIPAANSRLFSEMNIQTAPSLFHNSTTFTFEFPVEKLSVYNQFGQMIESHSVNDTKFELNGTNLAQGIYYAIPSIGPKWFTPIQIIKQ